MIAPVDCAGLVQAVGALPLHAVPGESEAPGGHGFFGAAFLLVGSLLVVETLAGQVWHRNRLRTMLWPAALIASGLGMLIVTYLQSTEKPLHLTLAFLLLAGGFVEARSRLAQISRTTADAIAVPVLVLSGLVIGPIHASGPVMSSVVAQTHLLVGVMAFALAGVRLTQLRYSSSATLDASFGAGVMLLGLSLLLVQQFHHLR